MRLKVILAILIFIYTTQSSAEGWVDTVSLNRYTGWACVKGKEEPVGIHIWRDDGIFLGGGNAPKHREQAVAEACETKNSAHGFDISIEIPRDLIDNKFHAVNIYLISETGNELLKNSPALIPFGMPNPNLEKPKIPGTVVGRDLSISPDLSWTTVEKKRTSRPMGWKLRN